MFENNNNDMVSSREVDKKSKALVSYNNNNNNKKSPLDCWGATCCYVQLKIPFYYWCGTRSYRGIVTMTKLMVTGKGLD